MINWEVGSSHQRLRSVEEYGIGRVVYRLFYYYHLLKMIMMTVWVPIRMVRLFMNRRGKNVGTDSEIC
jgi:hypothetical protein